MLLGDVLLCPPVVRTPREKAPRWVCRLRQTSQVEHGEAAFATAMRRSIDSDILERLGLLILAVSSLISDFPKDISVPTYPKSHLQLSPSHPTGGAYHDRHGRGEGCGGRGSVGRAMRAQGGLLSVSG